jgi:hypothetical protein
VPRRLLHTLGACERSDKLVRELVLDDLAPFVPLTMTSRGKRTDYEAKNVRLAGRVRDKPEGHARTSQNKRAAPA